MRLIDADVLLAKLREIGNEPDYQHNGEDWGGWHLYRRNRG